MRIEQEMLNQDIVLNKIYEIRDSGVSEKVKNMLRNVSRQVRKEQDELRGYLIK